MGPTELCPPRDGTGHQDRHGLRCARPEHQRLQVGCWPTRHLIGRVLRPLVWPLQALGARVRVGRHRTQKPWPAGPARKGMAHAFHVWASEHMVNQFYSPCRSTVPVMAEKRSVMNMVSVAIRRSRSSKVLLLDLSCISSQWWSHGLGFHSTLVPHCYRSIWSPTQMFCTFFCHWYNSWMLCKRQTKVSLIQCQLTNAFISGIKPFAQNKWFLLLAPLVKHISIPFVFQFKC